MLDIDFEIKGQLSVQVPVLGMVSWLCLFSGHVYQNMECRTGFVEPCLVVWIKICLLVLHRILLRRLRASMFVCAADLDRQLQEDLKRLQIKDKIGTDEAVSRAKINAVAEEDTGGSFQDIIDKVLIADFFFVLFALGWLAVGVGLKTSSGSTVRVPGCIYWFLAYEFPYRLWIWIFIVKYRLLKPYNW